MTMKLSPEELELLNGCGVMGGDELPATTEDPLANARYGTAPDEGGAGYNPAPRQTGLVFTDASNAPGIPIGAGVSPSDGGIVWGSGSQATGVPMRANQLDLINSGGIDWSAGKVGGIPTGGLDIIAAAATASGSPAPGSPGAAAPYVDDNDLNVSPLDHEAGLVFGAVFDMEEHTVSGWGIPDGGIPDTPYDAFFGDVEILEGCFGDVEIMGEEEVMGLFGIKMPKFIKSAVSAVTAPVTGTIKAAGKLAKGDLKGAVKAAAVDPFKAQLKLGKDVVKSPLVKVGAGALAVAFPPIGVPVAGGLALAQQGLSAVEAAKQVASAAGQGITPAAALSIADKMVRVADGTVPGKTPFQVDAMKRAIKNTAALSKQYGNPLQPAAQRAIEQMALALMLQQTRDAQMKRTLGGFAVRRFKKGLFKSALAKAKAKAAALTPFQKAAQQAVTTGRTAA